MTRVLFVGIDPGMKRHEVCFLDPEGQQIGRFRRFDNSRSGAQDLQKAILEVCRAGDFDRVRIATEATSVYDFHVLEFLADWAREAPAFLEVYRLNARQVARFKGSFPDDHKTDARDAFVIADRLRFGRLPQPYQPADARTALQRLTRFRFHLARAIAAEKNYFLVQLFLKFSAYAAEKPFSDPFGATRVAVIEDFVEADDILRTPPEELLTYLQDKGKCRFPDPEKVADTLRRVARESYRLRPNINESVNLVLALTHRNLRALGASLKEVDKAIADAFAAFHTTLQTVPGIGPVYAAGLFAEIGYCERYADNTRVARHAGLAWKTRQSVDFSADETPSLRGANRYLRYYLVEAANTVRQHEPDYRAFYRKKHAEARQHAHKRALVLTARKLVRLVFRLLKYGELYRSPHRRRTNAHA